MWRALDWLFATYQTFPYPGAAERCVDMALATQTQSNEQMIERLHTQEAVLAHSLAVLTNMPPVG